VSKEKTRRIRLSADGVITATPGWADAKVTIRNWTGSEFHEAIIAIEAPWQLSYLRRELDKIEAGWRERIERCK
jgi:hypothetical protein